MAARPPGSSGGGPGSRSALRLALGVLFVLYCVFLLQSSGRAHHSKRPSLRFPVRVSASNLQLENVQATPPRAEPPQEAKDYGPPAERRSGSAAPSVKEGCTAASGHKPITDPTLLLQTSEDEPQTMLAPGDRASEHVPALKVSFCKRYAVNRALITTAADQRYMVWARNWAKSLQANGVTNLFVGAMDAQALKESLAEGIPAVLLGRMRKGTTWHSANRYKIRLVQGVVELGFDVLFTDADVTFVRDPMPFLLKYPEAGVLISTDLLIREAPYPMRNGLENVYEIYGQWRADLNVGLMFVRATSDTMRMMNHWADVSNADMSKSMQTFFVKIVREYSACVPSMEHPELANCYNGTVNIGLLPMDKFCGGYIYFVERLPQRTGVEAVSVHATYQVHQGLDGKRERLRHAHLWFLDGPDYYDPPGGLLTMAPMQLPAWMHDSAMLRRYGERGDLRDDAVNRTLTHFGLVHFQLRQLRNALAVAEMLGRTLVMPDFNVLLDNTWYPMNGAWPGFRKLGPFVAPLDHILHMTQLQVHQIPYRSSTFLDHPCVKPSITDQDKASVAFVPGAPAPGPSHGDKVVLPKGASQSQIVGALQGHPAKVLHLESTMDITSGYDRGEDQKTFADKINRTPMLWCCITKNVANNDFKQRFPPGHIYYDFWYDQPHTDRFGRTYSGSWDLRVGP